MGGNAAHTIVLFAAPRAAVRGPRLSGRDHIAKGRECMATNFIRDKSCEYTGYQDASDYRGEIDLQCDFVMVYGIDKTMPRRIANFRKRGYVVHLMTGIAWGEYADYLYGRYDGLDHWDEAQKDRNGDVIGHGKDVPYMVPTIAFAEYITAKLKPAIDSGVEAIHLEEPEFWDRGSYSEAFKREYELYYKEKWAEPHFSIDGMYRCAKLKSYLYTRTLDRVFGALKEYAMVRYGRRVRFYVPTHSLLNYAQWKIISPEGSLIDLPTVDGYIAQIWTGTSRSPNIYEGVHKERTFETAYLEYGVMQELVSGTGRRMWFLHDPIEDNPVYTWEDYRENYLKTVVASLLHPKIYHYEICPWPHRVYCRSYPIDPATHKPAAGAKPIPPDYATLLNNIVNTLGDMNQGEYSFEGDNPRVGICVSDTCLFQRTYPDNILPPGGQADIREKFRAGNFDETDKMSMLALQASDTLPDFYGLALPLLKRGLQVIPTLLDNTRRFPGYLEGTDALVLSYEFMKPEFPDINNALAAWVRRGGVLIYVGDGSDPYHSMKSWWNANAKAQYKQPADHLFEMLGFPDDLRPGAYRVGNGMFAFMDKRPAALACSAANSAGYAAFVKGVLAEAGLKWEESGSLTLYRGNYIVSAAMDEGAGGGGGESGAKGGGGNDGAGGVGGEGGGGKTFDGLFVDLFTPRFDILRKKTLKPGENALLYDLGKIAGVDFCILGTSNRVERFERTDCGFILAAKGPSKVSAFTRLRLPKNAAVSGSRPVTGEWDAGSGTLLIGYASDPDGIIIEGKYIE